MYSNSNQLNPRCQLIVEKQVVAQLVCHFRGADSRAAIKDLSPILWNKRLITLVHNSPRPVPIQAK
jgi:hypothetical protein